MEIKVVTYEQERLEYFRKQLKIAERKYQKIEKFFKKNKEKEFDDAYHKMLSDAGRIVQFNRDIVEMLEKNLAEGAKNETDICTKRQS